MSAQNLQLPKRRVKISTAPYLFLLPAILVLIMFKIVPIFYSAWLSTMDYNIIMPAKSKFIGFGNYAKLFKDRFVWSGLLYTAQYAFGTLIPGIILSLAMAILICEKWFKGSVFVRATLFIPYILSITITGLIWSYMYQPNFGLFNTLLHAFGFKMQNFTSDVSQAMPCIIVMVIWRDMGYRITIWSAGLLSISQEYTDAARIDGASWLQELWYIRLPLLSPVTKFLTVLGLIGAFQAFDAVYVMTGGGPANHTKVLVFYIWQKAFDDMKLGYASAMAWVLFVLLMILTFIQFKLQREEVNM